MSTVIQCRHCGREVQSAGTNGVCPRCLWQVTTQRAVRGIPLLASSEELAEAQFVGSGGRFLLMQKLGEGGMGEVWLAQDCELSTDNTECLVALKFLSQDIRNNRTAIEELRKEVLRTQNLTHPNVVRVYDLHTSEQGIPFIKMEYFEADSLKFRLSEVPDGVLPWRSVVQIAHQAASALQYAHEVAGLVHRDVKPANLLITRNPRSPLVKLSDFGIAATNFASANHTELALGTLIYASPEQLSGSTPKPSDDIYAFGATLYELVTGTPPFIGDNAEEIISQVQYDDPEKIPARLARFERRNEINAKLNALIEQCLNKDPLKRPLAREIIKALPTTGGAYRPVMVAKPALDEPAQHERKEVNYSGAILLLCFCLGSLITWLNWGSIRPAIGKVFGNGAIPVTPGNPSNSNVRATQIPTQTAATQISSTATVRETAATRAGNLYIMITGDGAHRYRISNQHTNRSADLPSGYNTALLQGLPAGEYALIVTDDDNWTIQTNVTVQPDELSRVAIRFDWHLLEITSDPPDASVTWTVGAAGKIASAVTPASVRFRGGTFDLYAKAIGFPETRFPITNTANLKTVHLQLPRSTAPLFGRLAPERWTNSLGMPFSFVRSAGLFVCQFETRIGDFKGFAQENPAGFFNGMKSVTADGLKDKGSTWDTPGWPGTTDGHPVIGVSWNDALAFCKWLTEKEWRSGFLKPHQSYRLPTTNEWFQIAGSDLYPWGARSDVPKDYNYSGRELIDRPEWPPAWPILREHYDSFPFTAPASSGPQRGGFYHLGGNAAEWCMEKVLCGRSWSDGEAGELVDDIAWLQTRQVMSIPPGERHDRNGFRVVIAESEINYARE